MNARSKEAKRKLKVSIVTNDPSCKKFKLKYDQLTRLRLQVDMEHQERVAEIEAAINRELNEAVKTKDSVWETIKKTMKKVGEVRE